MGVREEWQVDDSVEVFVQVGSDEVVGGDAIGHVEFTVKRHPSSCKRCVML